MQRAERPAVTAAVSPRRVVHVIGIDDALARALSEQRKPSEGWWFGPITEMPSPDSLVILDLEDETERHRCVESLRARGFAGPLLILGDIGADGDLDDEPVGRPVRLGVLLARIDAHATDVGDRGTYRLGPYAFRPAERELRDETRGEAIHLTELESRLLSSLVQARGAVLGRDDLLARVWGYSTGVATHTVETHIWRLRQKIETADAATHFLATEAGGYRLLVADRDEQS